MIAKIFVFVTIVCAAKASAPGALLAPSTYIAPYGSFATAQAISHAVALPFVEHARFVSAPVIARYAAPTTSVVTTKIVSSPVITAKYVSSPVLTAKYVSSPVLTAKYVSSPILTAKYVSAPVFAAKYVSTPVVTKYVSAPVLTAKYVSAPSIW